MKTGNCSRAEVTVVKIEGGDASGEKLTGVLVEIKKKGGSH